MNAALQGQFCAICFRSQRASLGLRQLNPEAAAFAWLRFKTNFAAHAFDSFADNRQADAGAMVSRPVQPLKDAKGPFLLFGWNPKPIVLHPEPDSVFPFFGPQANGRTDARRNKFDCVA